MAYKSNAVYVRQFVEANYRELEAPGSFKFEPYGPGDLSENFEEFYGQRPMRRLFINAYELGQAYGGAEEGGWWITTYSPLASIPVTSLADAENAIRQLDAMLAEQYGDEREYTSAAGGANGTIMAESKFAEFQPSDPDAYRYS